ncbi:MAG: hypothetical protein ABIA78_04570 [archaeon]
MKKLIAILLTTAAFLFTNPNSISQGLENYRERAKFCHESYWLIDGVPTTLKSYFIYNKSNPEVKEVIFHPNTNPELYGFDFNGDGKFDLKEIFVDNEIDGLNGDETRYLDELKRSLEEANSPKKISI